MLAGIAAALILLAPAPYPAVQHADSEQSSEFTINVSVDLVIVNVSVLDRKGLPVVDLEASDFRVFDNDRPQQIQFSRHGEVPVSIGMVLDNSRSMRANRYVAVSAALQFLEGLAVDDEAFVLHFSDELLVDDEGADVFTSDRATLREAIFRLQPTGVTRLYDAIDFGLDQLEQSRWPRRALVVFSDGGDNGSRLPFEQLRARIVESETPVFLIGLVDGRWSEVDPDVLREIADLSGGMAFFPGRPEELAGIWMEAGELIHQQYVLGYIPDNAEEPGYHRIRVAVDPSGNPDVQVRTRSGYRVPE